MRLGGRSTAGASSARAVGVPPKTRGSAATACPSSHAPSNVGAGSTGATARRRVRATPVSASTSTSAKTAAVLAGTSLASSTRGLAAEARAGERRPLPFLPTRARAACSTARRSTRVSARARVFGGCGVGVGRDQRETFGGQAEEGGRARDQYLPHADRSSGRAQAEGDGAILVPGEGHGRPFPRRRPCTGDGDASALPQPLRVAGLGGTAPADEGRSATQGVTELAARRSSGGRSADPRPRHGRRRSSRSRARSAGRAPPPAPDSRGDAGWWRPRRRPAGRRKGPSPAAGVRGQRGRRTRRASRAPRLRRRAASTTVSRPSRKPACIRTRCAASRGAAAGGMRSTRRTGRAVRRVNAAQRAASRGLRAAPKGAPTCGRTTRSEAAGRPSRRASSARRPKGESVVARTTRRPSSSSQVSVVGGSTGSTSRVGPAKGGLDDVVGGAQRGREGPLLDSHGGDDRGLLHVEAGRLGSGRDLDGLGRALGQLQVLGGHDREGSAGVARQRSRTAAPRPRRGRRSRPPTPGRARAAEASTDTSRDAGCDERAAHA